MSRSSQYDDYTFRSFYEKAALSYILGIEPVRYFPKKDSDWMYAIINYHTQELINLACKNCPHPIGNNLQHDSLYNYVVTNTFLESLQCAKRFVSNKMAINISQISKYIKDMGYFEMCSKGILSNKDEYPDSSIKGTFDNERSIKPYYVLKTSKNFKEQIESSIIDSQSSRSKDATMRINTKAICFDKENKSINSYINNAIRWTDQIANDIPIYNTMLVYTILTKFRKFDSSLKSFQAYIYNTEIIAKTTKETRRLTRNLHKNYFLLADNIFKSIAENDSPEQYIDKYLYNYEMEKLFHFQLLPQILYSRRIIKKHYSEITSEIQQYIDIMLIKLTNLPNAFTRSSILLDILKRYFGISAHLDNATNGLIEENFAKFIRMDITKEKLENALYYIQYLARVFFPGIQKTSMYSILETIQSTEDYEFTYPKIAGKKPLATPNNIEVYSSEFLHLCKTNFFDNYLNPQMKNKDVTDNKNNYLLNSKLGYIKNKTEHKTLVNVFDYGFADIKELSSDEVDFLTNFFAFCFHVDTYNANNDTIFSKQYFGLNYNLFASDIQKKLIESTSKAYLDYAFNESIIFNI